jgi:hypothetical protein
MLTEARSRGGLASVPLEDPNSNAAIGDLNGKVRIFLHILETAV